MLNFKKRSVKVSTKLWIWTMGVVISAMLITGLVSYNRAVYELNQKNEIILKNAVNMAIQILKLQEKDVMDKESTLIEAQGDAIAIFRDNKDIDLGLNGYFIILDSAGNFIFHPTLTGKNGFNYQDCNDNFFVQDSINIAKAGGGFVFYNWINDLTGKEDKKMSYAVYFEPWDWVVETSTYLSDYNQVMLSMLDDMIRTFILVIVLVFFVIHLFVSELIIPLNETVLAMEGVKQGNFTMLKFNDRKDELGKLVSGYNN